MQFFHRVFSAETLLISVNVLNSKDDTEFRSLDTLNLFSYETLKVSENRLNPGITYFNGTW